MKELEFVIGEDGTATLYDDTYDVTIHCESEEEKQEVVKRLTAETKWMPCTEHPDTDRNVFIARGHGDFISCCIGYYDHGMKQWYEERNWFAQCIYDELYWCEMPPLPQHTGKECDSDANG